MEKHKNISALNPDLDKKKIAEALGIDSHTLREWIQLFPFIETEKNKSEFYRIEGRGSLSKTLNIESELIKWISEMRSLDVKLNAREMIIQAIKLYPNMKEINYKL